MNLNYQLLIKCKEGIWNILYSVNVKNIEQINLYI